MKKDCLLKAAALGAALITCLSGFTSRPVTQNKLPDVLNPLAKTMAEVADGISKAKTISFGKFGGYTDQTTLLNPDSAGSFGSLTVKETTRSNLEKTELSFSKASGVMTLFDFTLTVSEKHTITIDSDLSGKAKIILTKDNKTITPVWESTDGKQTTKTLTLEKGRYRVRLVVSESSGTIAVSVDEPKSLFSHTVEKAEKAYDKILDPALEEYEQAMEKAYEPGAAVPTCVPRRAPRQGTRGRPLRRRHHGCARHARTDTDRLRVPPRSHGYTRHAPRRPLRVRAHPTRPHLRHRRRRCGPHRPAVMERPQHHQRRPDPPVR